MIVMLYLESALNLPTRKYFLIEMIWASPFFSLSSSRKTKNKEWRMSVAALDSTAFGSLQHVAYCFNNFGMYTDTPQDPYYYIWKAGASAILCHRLQLSRIGNKFRYWAGIEQQFHSTNKKGDPPSNSYFRKSLFQPSVFWRTWRSSFLSKSTTSKDLLHNIYLGFQIVHLL